MLTSADISNATELLLSKAPFALWLVVLFFRFMDRRVITAGPRSLLCLLGAVLCAGQAWSDFESGGLRGNFSESSNSMPVSEQATSSVENLGFWLWIVAGACFAAYLFLSLRTWVGISDKTLHAAERESETTKRNSKKKNRKAEAQNQLIEPGGRWEVGFAVGGLVLLGYLGWSQIDVKPVVDKTGHGFALLHLLATMVLFCVAFFSAVETTFYLSPDTVMQQDGKQRFLVRWSLLSWIAQAMFLGRMLLILLLILRLGDGDAVEPRTQVLAASFAIALAILDFVAWMVPNRIRKFQNGAETTGWTSLALAAWLSALSYVVISVLPFLWPWQSLWN